MFFAVATKTMAGARQIVPDEGFERRTPRRDRLNALSREWEARRQAKAGADRLVKERAAEEVRKWKRRHRRTRFIVKETRTRHGDIIGMVAAWHGFTADDILDTTQRMKPLVIARRDAIEAVWRNCILEQMKPTLLSMGRVFNSDHTTVLYALRKRGLA